MCLSRPSHGVDAGVWRPASFMPARGFLTDRVEEHLQRIISTRYHGVYDRVRDSAFVPGAASVGSPCTCRGLRALFILLTILAGSA